MIETISDSECFLKQEIVDFVKNNYTGRPLWKKELKIVVDTMQHECLHHKIYALFGYSSKCSLGLQLRNNNGIDIKAGCRLKTKISLSEYFILTFVDFLQFIYDIITDVFYFTPFEFFWRIRTFIVEYIRSFSVLKELLSN